ncbi:hypothetical protein CGCS363_v015078 [Colletotrichum siamense]|uniref:uncharacterized protein n=1 Tax=Colletotrichum siamense TaxID=690259 RepID=UPI00187228E6|nr:uncharacterized protein CGCS363_v015078 [Colletotrichum siamense]KAF5483007.1 hypothetical protein CGCS363_v015078 [Colletotrichum siamense]
MAPVPRDLTAWKAQVIQQGIGNKTLGEIQRTSGSKIPHSAFLQLRAVWLPDKLASEATKNLYETGLIGDFTELINTVVTHGFSQADTFHNFLDDICGSSNTTPAPQSDESLVNAPAIEPKFSSFVVPLGQWKLLKPAAPQRVVAITPPRNAIKNKSALPLDYDKPPLPPSFSRELDLGVVDITSLVMSQKLETPSKVRVKESPAMPLEDSQADGASASPTRSPPESPAFSSGGESESEPIAQVAGRPESSSTISLRKPRTKYEVQTSNFFSSFFYAFFPHYLTFVWTRYLEVVTEEASYRFGGKHPVTSGTAPSPPPIFIARTDGAFYEVGDDGSRNKRGFLPFELKPYCRAEKLDATCREETAEMAAIIYEEFVMDNQHPPSDEQEALDKTHHRFMLSLNRDEFYITVATFTGHYISYISSTSTPSNPSNLEAKHLISFQPHGPFNLLVRNHMTIFREIMLSMALKKINHRGSKGQIVLNALQSRR